MVCCEKVFESHSGIKELNSVLPIVAAHIQTLAAK
jgi:hypothetical protein